MSKSPIRSTTWAFFLRVRASFDFFRYRLFRQLEGVIFGVTVRPLGLRGEKLLHGRAPDAEDDRTLVADGIDPSDLRNLDQRSVQLSRCTHACCPSG